MPFANINQVVIWRNNNNNILGPYSVDFSQIKLQPNLLR